MVGFIVFPVGVRGEALTNRQLLKLEIGKSVDGASREMGCSRFNVEQTDEFGIGACVRIYQRDAREVILKTVEEIIWDSPRREQVVRDSAKAINNFSDVDGAVGEIGNEQNFLVSKELGSGRVGVKEFLGVANPHFPDFPYLVEVLDSTFDEGVPTVVDWVGVDAVDARAGLVVGQVHGGPDESSGLQFGAGSYFD